MHDDIHATRRRITRDTAGAVLAENAAIDLYNIIALRSIPSMRDTCDVTLSAYLGLGVFGKAIADACALLLDATHCATDPDGDSLGVVNVRHAEITVRAFTW